MFELFPDQPVYEYPQLINITYSFLWAFVLASMIAITHKLTFTGDRYPKNFFQSLILGAIVTTLVMMAVGDSLARGLGVFGAMAIIRFRTRISDPRDVLFLFAALSTGLAIGVYGFTISFVGTVIFCLVGLLLHASPFRNYAHHNQLLFSIQDTNLREKIDEIVQNRCTDYRVVSVQLNKEMMTRYQYALSLHPSVTKDELVKAISKIEGVSQIKVFSTETMAS